MDEFDHFIGHLKNNLHQLTSWHKKRSPDSEFDLSDDESEKTNDELLETATLGSDLDEDEFDFSESSDEEDEIENCKRLIAKIYQENRQKRLGIRDKNWIPENIQLTTGEDKPQIFINSTQETPTINEIKLATITLNAEIPIYFNLKIIALHLSVDDYIRSIKCEKVCLKGTITVKKAKKNPEGKKGRKDRNDFYNQCTLTIHPYATQEVKINLKIFPNGKVSFTGVKKIVDAQLALEIFLDRINNLHGPVIYLINTCEKGNTKNFRKKLKIKQPMLEYLSDRSPYPADWETFITAIKTKGKNPYPNGLELPPEIGYGLICLEIMNTYYPLEHISKPETKCLLERILGSFVGAEPFSKLDPKQQAILEEYQQAGETSIDPDENVPDRFYLSLPAWWPQPYLLKKGGGKVEGEVGEVKMGEVKMGEVDQQKVYSFSDNLRETPMEIRPAWYHRSMINISNINTTFNYNFVLRRGVLYELLCNKYQQCECYFESNYGGINLKYLSRVECPEHDAETPINDIYPEYGNCRCKQVSVLIFTNIALVTGARSFHQIQEAYDFISNILLKEFAKIIKISKNVPHPSDQYPNIISSDKFIYLKKKFIVDNPKNHFLLSRNNLLEKYADF